MVPPAPPAGGGHSPASSPRQQPVSSEHLRTLIDMGFNERQARETLTRCNGDLNQAVEVLMSGA